MTKYLMGVELLNETHAMMALLARAYPSLIDQTFTDEVCLVRRLKDFVFQECSLLTPQNVLQLRDIQKRVQELKSAEDLKRRRNAQAQSQGASRQAPRGPTVNVLPQRRGPMNSSAGHYSDPVNPANIHDMTMSFESLTPQQKQTFQEETRLCQCVIDKYVELHRGVRHGAHAQTVTATGSDAIPAICARNPHLHHLDRIIVHTQHGHGGDQLPQDSPLTHILQRACEFQEDQHVHCDGRRASAVSDDVPEDDIHQNLAGPHHLDCHGFGVHHHYGCRGPHDPQNMFDHDHDLDGDGELQPCHCQCHRGSHIPLDYKTVLRWLNNGEDKDLYTQQLQRLAFVDAVSFMNRLDAMLEEKRRQKREKRQKRRARKASSKTGPASSSTDQSSYRRFRPSLSQKDGKIFQEPFVMGHIFCVAEKGRASASAPFTPSSATESALPTTGGEGVSDEDSPVELTHPASCGTIRTMFYLTPAASTLTEEALRSMGCIPVVSLESSSKRTTGTIMIHPEQGERHPLFVGQFHSPVISQDETHVSVSGVDTASGSVPAAQDNASDSGQDEKLDDTDKEDIIVWAAAVLEQGKTAVEEPPCVSQIKAARARRVRKSASTYRPELERINEAIDEQ